MKLEDFGISKNSTSLIVAEISGNHNGDRNKCFELVEIAKEVGADAVKFQTYTADTLTLNSGLKDFLIPNSSPWASYVNQHNLYRNSFTPWEWQSDLFAHAKSLDLLAFSSAFDETSVDFLESIDCPIFKLASPEINHLPLIQYMAKTNKPIIISLGTASRRDLRLAINEITSVGNHEIVIMQCDTSYPADLSNSNLNLLSEISNEYPYVIGYSDHTKNPIGAIVAVGLGAKVFEKHIIHDSDDVSVDSFFSSSKSEFAEYVDKIREAEKSLGKNSYRTQDGEFNQANKRSIYPKRDILKGQVIGAEELGVFRPGLSLEPAYLSSLFGKIAARNIAVGERISLKDFHD